MTPLLLFVDIETNGLNPITDEIIEIAGILCAWDTDGIKIISTFDQTIANIQPIDPTVTKITGLTDQALASSQKAFQVRDNWANWLEGQLENQPENNQEILVIGHSLIEFDAKFLKAQGWFLPEKAKFFDTFYLSKILLPQLPAVNLESLTVNLKLNPEVLMNSGSISPEKILPPRALYDTACCLDLWLKLVNFIRLYDLPTVSKKLLIQYFVGVKIYDLDLQANELHQVKSTQTPQELYKNIDWSGRTQDSSVAHSINQLTQLELTDASSKLEQIVLESNLKFLQIYLQLSVMLQAKLQYNWQVHVHGQKSDHSYISYIWNEIKNKTNNKIQENQKAKTPLLENLIWQVDEIANRTVNMLELVNLINIVQGFDSPNPDLALAVTKLFNSYDFWLISLNQFWVKSQYIYKPNSMPINQEGIYHRFQTLIENMASVQEQLRLYLSGYTKLEISLNSKLFSYNWLYNWLEKSQINYTQDARLSQVRDTIKILYHRAEFNLIQSFGVLLRDEQVVIPTYLNPKQVESLINLYELNPIKDLIIDRLIYKYQKEESNTRIAWIDGHINQLEDEYMDYQNNSQDNSQTSFPRLWLANTNSTITKIANTLEKIASDRNSYNIVGLTGSITKITSKIRAGFDGIGVIKQTDIYMLKNLKGIKWDKITIIGNYHSFISPIFDYINLPTNANKKLELTQLQNNSLRNQIIISIKLSAAEIRSQ